MIYETNCFKFSTLGKIESIIKIILRFYDFMFNIKSFKHYS